MKVWDSNEVNMLSFVLSETMTDSYGAIGLLVVMVVMLMNFDSVQM